MKKTSFLIAGKHAVTEALKNPNRKVLKVFLTEDSKKKLNKDNQNSDLLKNINLFYKTKNEMDRLCSKDQISHQGLIAEIEHFETNDLKDYLTKAKKNKDITFVALEEVTDPRNIGSIIRSASSFNIDGMYNFILRIKLITSFDFLNLIDLLLTIILTKNIFNININYLQSY